MEKVCPTWINLIRRRRKRIEIGKKAFSTKTGAEKNINNKRLNKT